MSTRHGNQKSCLSGQHDTMMCCTWASTEWSYWTIPHIWHIPYTNVIQKHTHGHQAHICRVVHLHVFPCVCAKPRWYGMVGKHIFAHARLQKSQFAKCSACGVPVVANATGTILGIWWDSISLTRHYKPHIAFDKILSERPVAHSTFTNI